MNRAQRMATAALARAEAVKADASLAGDYKPLAKKAPVLVQQSGLVQALVFIQSRGTVGARLLDDLALVLGRPTGGGAALVSAARTLPTVPYLALTREVIQALVWLRRFVQIEMGD